MNKNDIQTIGIVGTGNFATVLRRLLSRNPNWTIKQSSRTRTIDSQDIFPLVDVMNCDVVFLSIPISTLREFLQKNSHLIRPDRCPLVCDLCSVKEEPSNWLTDLLPHNIDVMATHPLFGPQSTKMGTQFENLRWIVSLIRVKRIPRVNKLFKFILSQGIIVQELSPTQHDQIMARSQAVSFLFGRLGQDLQLKPSEFDTQGFSFLLNNQAIVASDTSQLFLDIFRHNRFAKEMLLETQQRLDRIQREITKTAKISSV